MIPLEEFYRQMLLIRRFEERLLELFAEGLLFGTTHCYIGQEANAVALMGHLKENDVVVSNHRCHGHYLARTGDVLGLLSEIMGRDGGICGGRGGSQHLCAKNFFTNGVLGSTVPIAAGMAYAQKLNRNRGLVATFIGDGALGQGVVYESLNLASLWNIPLLIVIENNRYAQSTPIDLNFSGDFSGRAEAFAIKHNEIETTDVRELHEKFRNAVQYVRTESRPFVQVIHTYRFCGHSKGDDFRKETEIASFRKRDPLEVLKPLLSPDIIASTGESVAEEIRVAEEKARKMPFPSLEKSKQEMGQNG